MDRGGGQHRRVEMLQEIEGPVVDLDRVPEVRILPASRAECDRAYMRVARRLDVVRRVPDHDHVRGGLAQASALVDACKLATLAPSLGGVDTLIEQPSLMSYYELTTAEREAIGIYDNLIRLSVGIEDAQDIEADLAQALERAA